MGVRIPWLCLEDADALKQRYFWFFQPLQDGLKVGAHDFIHAADSGIEHKIVHFDFSSFAVKTDRFDYGIQADLIPELETVGKLVLDPALEGYLKNKAFFSGEKYWQVAAMGRMAAYATGFFLDILAQQMIWEPMTSNLQKHLGDNVRGMETLREKAIDISREISCIEAALNKPSM